jgi:hypothetical protein
MENPFAVDKDESLEIFRSVLSKFDGNDDDTITHHNLEVEDDVRKISEHKHNISVAEVEIGNYGNKDNLNDHIEEFLKAVENGEYEISDSIEIYRNSRITPKGRIYLEGYLHDTNLECDESFCTFEYFEKIRCWVLIHGSQCSTGGIECTGTVMILDIKK